MAVNLAGSLRLCFCAGKWSPIVTFSFLSLLILLTQYRYSYLIANHIGSVLLSQISSMGENDLEPWKKKSQSVVAVNFGFQIKEWAYLHYNNQNKFEEVLKKPKTEKLVTPSLIVWSLVAAVALVIGVRFTRKPSSSS